MDFLWAPNQLEWLDHLCPTPVLPFHHLRNEQVVRLQLQMNLAFGSAEGSFVSTVPGKADVSFYPAFYLTTAATSKVWVQVTLGKGGTFGVLVATFPWFSVAPLFSCLSFMENT